MKTKRYFTHYQTKQVGEVKWWKASEADKIAKESQYKFIQLVTACILVFGIASTASAVLSVLLKLCLIKFKQCFIRFRDQEHTPPA